MSQVSTGVIDGVGAGSGSYTVTFDLASAGIGALIVDGGVSTLVPNLRISATNTRRCRMRAPAC